MAAKKTTKTDGYDKARIAELMDEINAKHGDGSIFTLSDSGNEARLEINRVSTGLPDLDDIIGGGLPKGRITEIFGAESAGKTSLTYHIASQYPFVLFIDMEGTFLPSQARLFGNKKDQMIVHRPEWGEIALNDAYNFAIAGCPLIIIDSVPMMISRKAMEETDMEKVSGMALIANLLTRNLPKISAACEKSGTTLLLTNQLRDKFNAVPFGEQYSTPGGHMLKHLASLRIKIARKQALAIDSYKFGQISKLLVQKSKVSAPMGEAELMLIYNRGFMRQEQLPDIRKDVRAEIRQKEKAKKELNQNISPLLLKDDDGEDFDDK